VKRLLLAVILGAMTLYAQVDSLEGLWQGYDGEWGHVSRQLIALAEKIPAEKYAWRPGPGVHSTSEVFMHINTWAYYFFYFIRSEPSSTRVSPYLINSSAGGSA
jgi:hypothetical protein